MPHLLAIDQGTTSTKAYTVDEKERPSLLGSRVHRQIRPAPGWVEHDAAELLGHVQDLIAASGPAPLVALANQGETVVAWDASTKRPAAHAIVWQDERTRDVTETMRRDGLEALTLERAGLPLDPYFSASKLRWLLDNAEGARDLHRQGRLRLGTSDSFFLDALTGTFATDVSTASRTSLLNLASLRWDDDLCGAFGVPMDCLAEIRPTVADFGALPGGGAVVASAVDQQASLFGHGCQAPGDLKITFGTGAFALGLAAPTSPAGSGLVSTVAWQLPGHEAVYALEGGMLTAGAALEWLRDVGLIGAFDELEAAPGETAASRGLFFVPAQAGLGCPYWDRDARGAWFGLGLDTSRRDLGRAVLEGIAFRAVQLVRAYAQASGVVSPRVSVDGGLTRSASFVRFLSAALAQPVLVADTPDLTAVGMLRFGALGAALDTNVEVAWRTVQADRALDSSLYARFGKAVEASREWSAGA